VLHRAIAHVIPLRSRPTTSQASHQGHTNPSQFCFRSALLSNGQVNKSSHLIYYQGNVVVVICPTLRAISSPFLRTCIFKGLTCSCCIMNHLISPTPTLMGACGIFQTPPASFPRRSYALPHSRDDPSVYGPNDSRLHTYWHDYTLQRSALLPHEPSFLIHLQCKDVF